MPARSRRHRAARLASVCVALLLGIAFAAIAVADVPRPPASHLMFLLWADTCRQVIHTFLTATGLAAAASLIAIAANRAARLPITVLWLLASVAALALYPHQVRGFFRILWMQFQ